MKSLFTAKPGLAPSLTGESPLRPILGWGLAPTSVGDRHLRQRKLLLPPFHGEAVARYVEMIDEVTERELDSWPVGEPMALAPRMQAITLDVIMRGIFGVDDPQKGRPSTAARGHPPPDRAVQEADHPDRRAHQPRQDQPVGLTSWR